MTDESKKPYFILFNGPPRSGKDTLGHQLFGYLLRTGADPIIAEFKEHIRHVALYILGIQPEDYEARKDEFLPEWHTTLRQFMIDFSEQFMKPKFGDDVWPKAAYHALGDLADNQIVIFTDLGFPVELEYLQSRTDPERVIVVQLEREGCDWSKDSRNYVFPREKDAGCIIIMNKGPVEEVGSVLLHVLDKQFGYAWRSRRAKQETNP
ncbi:hypothetical protein [Alterisphingorhabdus coralli]|uniref:Deoxynucleotide monophosphate kinase n=1 Tax=Alterisphingorhabdus coralli TaxID=3071408 RepID=A0AA97I140_9SPHN|nr:hypothetical protein [Parasphingorhabdus sp. SCSIO 66989]WOE76339.1 hypothetical protein RB602_06400 [Parasphingorhabdus sp. SCSIO 66989]